MTEAGKIMLEYLRAHLSGVHGREDPSLPGQFAAIEAEAVAAERARIRAIVEGLRGYQAGLTLVRDPKGAWVSVTDLLDHLDAGDATEAGTLPSPPSSPSSNHDPA